MRGVAAFALLLVGCVEHEATRPSAPPAPVASVAAPASTCEDAPPVLASFDHFEPPMSKTSAETCTVRTQDVVLGAESAKPLVAIGFGASSGLLAWTDEMRGSFVRPVDATGAPTGGAVEVTAKTKTALVRHVVALACGFVTLFEKGTHRVVAALVTDLAGHPLGELQALDVDLRTVADAAPLGPRKFALLAVPSSGVSSLDVKAKSVVVDVEPNGNLTSKVSEIPVAVGSVPHLERVRFAGAPEKIGWLADTWTEANPTSRSFIVDGQVHGVADVERLGGKVVERGYGWSNDPSAATRLVDGKPYGKPVALPPGSLTSPAVWSGSHIVRAFGAEHRVRVSAVDCRPAR